VGVVTKECILLFTFGRLLAGKLENSLVGRDSGGSDLKWVYWLQTSFHWCDNNAVFIVDVSRVYANSLRAVSRARLFVSGRLSGPVWVGFGLRLDKMFRVDFGLEHKNIL